MFFPFAHIVHMFPLIHFSLLGTDRSRKDWNLANTEDACAQSENMFPSMHVSFLGTDRTRMDWDLANIEDARAQECASTLKIACPGSWIYQLVFHKTDFLLPNSFLLLDKEFFVVFQIVPVTEFSGLFMHTLLSCLSRHVQFVLLSLW